MMWRFGTAFLALVLLVGCSAPAATPSGAPGGTPSVAPAATPSWAPGGTPSVAPAGTARPSSPATATPATAIVGGTWTRLDDMSVPRWSFTAIELVDGRIFAVDREPCNGMSYLGGPPHPSGPADILDPRTGRWSEVPAFGATRTSFAAVRLADGRVLIAGGDNGWWGSYSSTKVFDPATGAWSAAGLMSTGRDGPVAALLPDGRVLVAGGTYSAGFRDQADFEDGGPWPDETELTSAEIYDPAAGRWAPAAGPHDGVTSGTAYPLPDGRLLVIAPRATGEPAVAQVYDPGRDSWADAGTLALPEGSASVVLEDGSLLVVGGTDAARRSTTTVSRFDPVTGRSVDVAPLPASRSDAAAVRLPDGRVLVAGGSSFDETVWSGSAPATSTAFVYDPTRDTWAPTAPMPFADRPGAAQLLSDGSVLVTGGSIPFEGEVADACEPTAVGWTALFRLDASGD